jgi:hypothetical protein
VGNRSQAITFFNAGYKATQDRSYETWATHAFGLFQSACLVDPTFGQGWAANGHHNGDLNRFHSAVACYRRALDGDLGSDERVKVLSNMAWRCMQIGELEQALECSQKAIDIDPTMALAWVNLSNAHGKFGERTAAVQAAWKAHELAPNNTAVQFNLAFALLFNEQYAEGFQFFESRFAERLQNYMTYPYPRWQGEPDLQVFLVADQGLGDTLSFARFIPLAAERAKFLHCMVQPALMRAFTETFCHFQNVSFTPFSTSYPTADVWTTFVSLPFALQLTDGAIKSTPHTKLPVYGMTDSWKVPDVKLHVGIQWAGAAKNDIDMWRSFPMLHFLDLYRAPGIQLYSLQIDEKKQDLATWCCESLVRDLSPWVSDVTDTVAILQHLDLVICCESALAHIAGHVGKEVWIPYSFHAHDYRLGHGDSPMLWYGKTHRLFRQDRDMQWNRVFARITDALREKVDAIGTVDRQAGTRKQKVRA